MNYKIPTRFTLLGHEYIVEIVDDLYENEDCYGEADPETKKIKLQSVGEVRRKVKKRDGSEIFESVTITEEDLIETFFHELVHIILNSMGESKLYKNEKFVSLMGKCFMEIEKTKTYESSGVKK